MSRLAKCLAATGVGLGLVAGLALLASGPGTRLGLWHFSVGFALLRWGAQIGAVAGGLSLLALVLSLAGQRRAVALIALVGVLVGGSAFLLPWTFGRQARSVPPIHDVTTDPDDPPAFVALVPARQGAPNGVVYGGPAVAALQRAGYPDLAPLDLPAPPDQAFQRVEAAARSLGWTVLAAQPAEGRLEATATTPWFGFRDDVVVRVRPRDGGSRIDVRSVSRVGRSDLGANAARIRRFLQAVSR